MPLPPGIASTSMPGGIWPSNSSSTTSGNSHVGIAHDLHGVADDVAVFAEVVLELDEVVERHPAHLVLHLADHFGLIGRQRFRRECGVGIVGISARLKLIGVDAVENVVDLSRRVLVAGQRTFDEVFDLLLPALRRPSRTTPQMRRRASRRMSGSCLRCHRRSCVGLQQLLNHLRVGLRIATEDFGQVRRWGGHTVVGHLPALAS